jgi:hypothetical protein
MRKPYANALMGLILACFPIATASAAGVVGGCRFDPGQLAFEGQPTEQGRCLLRPVAKFGHVGAPLPDLPPTLGKLIGNQTEVSPAALRRQLDHLGLAEAAVGGSLDAPVSRARGGKPTAPLAKYFVIHDTSAPWLGNEAFPADIDSSTKINGLKHYAGPKAVAHLFVNRSGDTLLGHDLSIPWRATKLETAVVGVPAKGLFLHVELVQPRQRDPNGGPKNDAIAPLPGFAQAQYDKLALIYVAASVRAGAWLVPAFHATVDEGLSDAHDDPQNFELTRFDDTLGSLLQAIGSAS